MFVPSSILAERPASRYAFSLVELIMAICVIAVLVTLIVPIVSGVKERAHQSSCTSNLRQLGVALKLYANENEGRIPLNGAPHYWMGELAEYVGEPERAVAYTGRKGFKCPAYPGNPEWQTYCFNGWMLNPTHGVKRMDEILRPERTIVLYDSFDGHVSDTGIMTITNTIRWSHGNGESANFLMAGGNVESFDRQSSVAGSYLDVHWRPQEP